METNKFKDISYEDETEHVEEEDKFSIMKRAERVLSNTGNDLPQFVKCMSSSNVARGFWLHFPAEFCKLHLPNRDTYIMLVDELGMEYKTSFLVRRHGLSAGWKRFSLSHSLSEGDLLIFNLIEPCKFKVHIVRVDDSDVVDAALILMRFGGSGSKRD